MAETKIDYQAVFRALPGALALLTPEGVVLDVNEGFLEAAGRKREHVLGRTSSTRSPRTPMIPMTRARPSCGSRSKPSSLAARPTS